MIRGNAVAEKDSMRHDDAGTSESTAFEAPHDELQKQQRSFGGPAIIRKIRENTGFFLTAERWIRQDDFDPISLADLRQLESQCVAEFDVGRLDPMQQ